MTTENENQQAEGEALPSLPCSHGTRIEFTSHHALKDLQHRIFPTNGGAKFDCSNKAPDQIVDALRIAERGVNEAIQEGAHEVKIQYLNIPDEESNPDGHVGTIRVVGYRMVDANSQEQATAD